MRQKQAAKSEATRERILEAALSLFAEKGFAEATMRGIAERSGCSLGLAYRYYRSKDALALALYERLMEEYSLAVTQLERGPLAMRWAAATRSDFARLAPHRRVLTGLISAGLTPGSATQVLGGESRPIRLRMLVIFGEIVSGATDLPRTLPVESLCAMLYGLHLLLVLFWLQDPTPGQRATMSLIALCEEYIGWLKLLSRLPGFGSAIQRLTGILRPILEGAEDAEK